MFAESMQEVADTLKIPAPAASYRSLLEFDWHVYDHRGLESLLEGTAYAP